ncbi:hypothetical protein AVEN_115273-1 [Araneus ventricosus]|uniref:Uncharacterized protein n=1 Tax=Araneus ventricosus TaxID=182803 RepID=A0A4Y1ZZ39_ARAVE|nr:hypothetical protein AVEN_115273-1 [Araneus ventricosus]
MVKESTSRQKMLPNVPKHLRKRKKHISFFSLCTQDEFTRTLLHNEVPKYSILNNGNKTWQRRKQGQSVLEEAEIRSFSKLYMSFWAIFIFLKSLGHGQRPALSASNI